MHLIVFRRMPVAVHSLTMAATGIVLSLRRSRRMADGLSEGPLAPPSKAATRLSRGGESIPELSMAIKGALKAAAAAAATGVVSGEENGGPHNGPVVLTERRSSKRLLNKPEALSTCKKNSATKEIHAKGDEALREMQQPGLSGEAEVLGRAAMSEENKKEPPVRSVKRRVARASRSSPGLEIEERLWSAGYRSIAGVDEAGRGPLAGPVVAAACILPREVAIEGIDDSKRMTEAEREAVFDLITTCPGVRYALFVQDAARVDEINILQATLEAMEMCVRRLSEEPARCPPDYILVDGNRLPDGFDAERAEPIIKGDCLSQSIAAASIVAKVTRDRLMVGYHEKWPHYGFNSHKGYGTVAHISALLKHGPCEIHRKTFAPLKDWNLLSE